MVQHHGISQEGEVGGGGTIVADRHQQQVTQIMHLHQEL